MISTVSIKGNIVIDDSLFLYVDAMSTKSYPRSGTSWNDLTKYNNHGTLINGPTFTPAYGGGFVFDATDDYVNTTNLSNLSPSSPLTLNVWVDTISGGPLLNTSVAYLLPSSVYTLAGVTLFSAGSGFDFYLLEDSWETTGKYLYVNGGDPSYTYPIINLTVTYDGSNDANGINAFINGVSLPVNIVNNQPLTQSPTYNIPWQIGTVLDNINNIYVAPYNGTIYLAQVYNRVLSNQEILQNHNSLKSRYGII